MLQIVPKPVEIKSYNSDYKLYFRMPDTIFPFPMKPLQLGVNCLPMTILQTTAKHVHVAKRVPQQKLASMSMTILQTPAKHVHVGQRIPQQKLASMSMTNQAAHKKVDCREISFGCKLLFPFVLIKCYKH